MVSHTEFQIANNTCHPTFHQCFRIKPHSSSLKNVKNSTNNFRPSVRPDLCREEQREENSGNCKNFRVTRKCKKEKLEWQL